MKMLKSVDLEGRGFQKEEFRKMLSTGNKLLSLHDHTLLFQDGEVFRSDANRHEIGQAVSRLVG